MFEGSVTEGDRGVEIVTTDGGVRRVMLSPARLVGSAEEIDRAYGEARARANEGVMLKAAGSVYQPGRRGLAWVKLKRELATLDVVITGVEYGSGRKAQLLSDYTFAVRGEGGELLNVGKAYSGVTDAEIVELTEWCKAHTLEDRGHFRTVEPAVVLEVAFNNVMRSDRHASGFALRFPRIVHIRRDKPVEEIDTVERVEEVYASQVDRPAEGAGEILALRRGDVEPGAKRSGVPGCLTERGWSHGGEQAKAMVARHAGRWVWWPGPARRAGSMGRAPRRRRRGWRLWRW